MNKYIVDDIFAALTTAIPLWFIMSSIKNRISIWMKRRSLINRSIISVGQWYEICGMKGKVKYIGAKDIHMEGKNELLISIPIEEVKAVRAIKPDEV